MRTWAILLAAGICAATVCLARDYRLEERETFQRTLSGASSLDVDNINGFIHVTGDAENTIRVDGEKIMRARDDEEMARAKREVTLDVNEKNGVAQLYVNGPFRDHDHTSSNHGFHDREDRHYEVTYNLTIRVPRAIGLTLKTVNGEVTDRGTSGKFDIHGLNGHITMTDIAGSGTVKTLNGATVVSFRENQRADYEFNSFNGKVDVTFQPNLAAKLKVKTFNGAAYTDFEATALASADAASRDGNKWVYRKNRSTELQVGNGGPELSFDTFNGSISIRKAK